APSGTRGALSHRRRHQAPRLSPRRRRGREEAFHELRRLCGSAYRRPSDRGAAEPFHQAPVMSARVSCDVVIPARNAEQYLADAVDSVLAQDGEAIRVIVVDDRSTDRTAAIAASYGDAVRAVEGDGRNAGAARNLGVRAGDAEFIAFLDADDRCQPD